MQKNSRDVLLYAAEQALKRGHDIMVHETDDGPPVLVVMSVARWRLWVDQVFGEGAEIPTESPLWSHDHATPELVAEAEGGVRARG